jgi:hypothetical protein
VESWSFWARDRGGLGDPWPPCRPRSGGAGGGREDLPRKTVSLPRTLADLRQAAAEGGGTAAALTPAGIGRDDR